MSSDQDDTSPGRDERDYQTDGVFPISGEGVEKRPEIFPHIRRGNKYKAHSRGDGPRAQGKRGRGVTPERPACAHRIQTCEYSGRSGGLARASWKGHDRSDKRGIVTIMRLAECGNNCSQFQRANIIGIVHDRAKNGLREVAQQSLWYRCRRLLGVRAILGGGRKP